MNQVVSRQFKLLMLAIGFSLLASISNTKNALFAMEQSNVAKKASNVFPSDSFKEDRVNSANALENSNITSRRNLTLSTCFMRSAENNKEIAVAASNLPIAQSQITIAKAIPNPTYNLTYGFGPAWAYIIAGNNQQFGWNEEIQVLGKRSKKAAVARANCWQIFLQIQAVRFNVHNRVRRAFTELAVANAYAKLIVAQENIASKLLDIAQKRFDAGKAPGSEVLQAKLNFTQLETQANLVQTRLVQDSAQLAYLLGETPNGEEIIDVDDVDLNKLLVARSGLVPDFDLTLPSLDKLLAVAWQQRNDLRAAVQQAYVNRKAFTLAKSARVPDPFVGFSYLFSTYKPYQQQYFTPQPNAHQVPYQPGYLITVAEEMPIFYQYQGEVNQAKAAWTQQLKQNEQLRSQIALDVVTSYESLQMNVQNLHKCSREILPAALTASRLCRRGYELGKTDLATAILAQQQYGQLAASYFDTTIAYRNAWADLEKAVGVPLNF